MRAATPPAGVEAPDYAVLRWLVGATFVVILNETVMMNAIPRLMADFRVDAGAAQWLSTIFMLTMAVVIPATGWFLQRVTTRFAFALAMGVFCAGTLLAAAAWTFPVLLVARVVQAGGTAVMMPLLMTTLMAVVPEHDRGRVMGNVTLAMSVAPALGPAVSGLVLSTLSWRWIFLVVLPIAAAIAAQGVRRLGNVGEPVVGRLDWGSVVIAGIGFGSLVYGLSGIGTPGDDAVSYAAMSVGMVGVALFVWRQLVLQRTDRPLLDLRTLRVPIFAISLAAMAVAFMTMLGSMILLQLYLQNVRGMTPLATGLLVMPGGLAMGLLGPRVGRVYDAFGARVLVLPGGLGLVVAMGVLAASEIRTPLWHILAANVLLMVSLAAMFTPLFTMGLGSLPPRLYSHGSSLLGTTQQVAGAMGTALVVTVMSGRVSALSERGAEATAASMGGLQWGLAVSVALAVVALGLVALLPARLPAVQAADSALVARAPAQDAHDHHPQLGAGAVHDRLLRMRARGQDHLGGADHRGDDQVGQDLQVLGGPGAGVGQPGQVGGELALDQVELVPDRGAHGRGAGHPLPGDEREVGAPRVHVLVQHRDRAVDDVEVLRVAAAYVAEHLAQRHERLLDQHHAELLDRVEVPVEGRRDDAHLLGHLTQGERDQAAVLAQLERCVQDRPTGPLLALAT